MLNKKQQYLFILRLQPQLRLFSIVKFSNKIFNLFEQQNSSKINENLILNKKQNKLNSNCCWLFQRRRKAENNIMRGRYV